MSQDSPYPDGNQLPLAVERQIDRLSDEFERVWKVGPSPRIEDYLDRIPAGARTQLFDELLALEFDLLEQQGQPPDVNAYRQRFPGMDEGLERAMRRQLEHVQIGGTQATADKDQTNGGDDQPPDPTSIGRFSIQRRLGQGGSGIVYLAHDPRSDRLVALKVPRSEFVAAEQQRESLLQEARAASALAHPGLVPVHEVLQEGKRVYIVQEYVDGQNLAQWASAAPRSWRDIAGCLAEITTAIAYVHQHGFCHRDLKPNNILVDKAGHVRVADFGLAIHEDAQRLLKGKVAGTPPYMSPEQCRGETHWIDGRTDIWALGVILYELMTQHRPFTGADDWELYAEIQERDPKPPRMRHPEVPKELERICLKCLAKRRTQRYASASDLLDDLQAFLQTSTASTPAGPHPNHGERPAPIVPKGLRSFDKEDKDFFLGLLPGARDREGLPECVRFWKTRLEEVDAGATFAVGVMYGPSGCGKSSIVKAGLLPRLAGHVLPILVEAAREDTELRLLGALHKRLPALAKAITLPAALAQLRAGRVTPGQKVLVVLDQFEQWLHVASDVDSSPLVRALRQCDGAHVQCLILVRDDFWLSATRFMQALEIPLLEGVNSALVDLFDPSHARNILRAFGLAYGRLPEGNLTMDQQQFLDRAVEELAHDGKVICVQLALFAEMMKSRPWTPVSLQELGGASGVGVAFLDETFDDKTAPPTHRLHAHAARALLKALLPDTGIDIRGQIQPACQLRESAGYAHRPHDFRDLLQILDSELRLITPTEHEDSESPAAAPPSAADVQQFYQLTHDYLVPSLREWLTRKQQETRRGRAELKMAERAALWSARPENRHLPSVWEYGRILALTKRMTWTVPQRKMMKRALRIHGIRATLAVLSLLLLAWTGFEVYGRVQAGHVLAADPATLPTVMAELSPWQLWAKPYLRRVAEGPPANDAKRREELHARLAYARMTGAYDPELLVALYTCDIPYLGVIRDVLQPHADQIVPALWDTLHRAGADEPTRFRAGVALATYETASVRWSAADYTFLAGRLVKENPIHQPQLWRDLLPVSEHLIPELEKLFADQKASESQQIGAANALATFAREDGLRLARLLSTATVAQYEILFPLVSNWPDGTVKTVLANEVAQQPAGDLSQQDRVALGRQRAGAAIGLMRLGEVEKSHRVFQIQDDPESLTQFVHRCPDRGVKAGVLINSFHQAADTHSRFALLLTLGDYPLAEIEEAERDGLTKELSDLYRSDPSSAIHGAAGWLLRKWGFEQAVLQVDHTPLPYDETGKREWYVVEISPRPRSATDGLSDVLNQSQPDQKIYFTFVVLPSGEYSMGSPVNEVNRQTNELLHRVQLTRRLAMSAYEVTWAEYDPIDVGEKHRAWERQFNRKLTPQEPVFGVNWYEAVAYCRWLTVQRGWSEMDQCYSDPQSLPKDVEGNPRDTAFYPDRRGYRLPTEAEWEYACRSGTQTTFSFGNAPDLLRHYAWFIDSSQQWSHAVGRLRPNLWGLFDVHGNLFEWCHDWYNLEWSPDIQDPIAAKGSFIRVLRGGGFISPASCCRSAIRYGDVPPICVHYLGFRIVAVPSGKLASQAVKPADVR